MALTLTYKVKNLKVRDQVNSEGATLQNAVVQTYWEVTGTDENGNSAMWAGATPFSAENVPAGSFKAFENLTEADVLSWIQNVVNSNPSYKAHIEEQIQKEMDKDAVTEVEAGSLPWAEPVAPADPDAPAE